MLNCLTPIGVSIDAVCRQCCQSISHPLVDAVLHSNAPKLKIYRQIAGTMTIVSKIGGCGGHKWSAKRMPQ